MGTCFDTFRTLIDWFLKAEKFKNLSFILTKIVKRKRFSTFFPFFLVVVKNNKKKFEIEFA